MRFKIVASAILITSMLSLNAAAEIDSVYMDDIDSGICSIKGKINNVVNDTVRMTVLKPQKVANSESIDEYALIKEIRTDDNGNFNDSFYLSGETGYYIVRVGCNNQLYENRLLYVSESDSKIYLNGINMASNATQIADLLRSDNGKLKKIFEITQEGTGFDYISEVIYNSKPQSGYSSMSELKKSTVTAYVLDSFESGNVESAIANIQLLFPYFCDNSSGVISIFNSTALITPETKKSAVSEIISNHINTFSEFEDVFCNLITFYALKNASNAVEGVEILNTVKNFLNYDKYSEFSALNPEKQYYIFSCMNKNFDSVSSFKVNLKNAQEAALAVKNEGSVDSSSSNTSTSGTSFTAGGAGATDSTAIVPIITPDVKPQKVFSDTDGVSWAYDAIETLYKKGVINGTGGGMFEPSRSVKREEFVKMLAEAYNLTFTASKCEFTDVAENSWYYNYVLCGIQNNIINGLTSDFFGVGMDITREDAVTICYRLMKDFTNSKENKTSFLDENDISDYAKEAVAVLNGCGVVNGMPDNKFYPKKSVTRAEAAVIVYNLLNFESDRR